MENQYSNEQRENQLTDKGWEAMRTLLDRELPEEPRRRPAAAWWRWMAVLLLLPLVAGAGWWLQQGSSDGDHTPVKPAPQTQQQAQRPAAEPIAAAPAAEKPVTAPASAPGNGRLNPAESTTAPRTARHTAAAPPGTPRSARHYTPAVAQTPATTVPVETEATRPEPVRRVATLPAPARALTTTRPRPATSLQPVAPEALAAHQPTSRPGVLSGLTTGVGPVAAPALTATAAATSPAAINTNTAASPAGPAAQPIEPHRQPAHWAFGATAGVASQSLPRINGLTAGLSVDLRLGKSWGLRSGVNYRYQYAGSGNRVIAAIRDSVYAETTGNYDVLPLSNWLVAGSVPATSYVLVPIKAQHRLEVPLSVFWEPVRNFRVYGGAGVSYLLSAEATTSSYASGTDRTFEAAYDAQTNSQLNSLAVQQVDRWQFDARFALGYRIGRRAEITLSYHQPFTVNGLVTERNNLDADPQLGVVESTGTQSTTAKNRRWFGLSGTWFF